jgi:hypothetical protein
VVDVTGVDHHVGPTAHVGEGGLGVLLDGHLGDDVLHHLRRPLTLARVPSVPDHAEVLIGG